MASRCELCHDVQFKHSCDCLRGPSLDKPESRLIRPREKHSCWFTVFDSHVTTYSVSFQTLVQNTPWERWALNPGLCMLGALPLNYTPAPFFFFTLYFEIGAHKFVPLDSLGRLDLELVILLPEHLVLQASNTRPI